jgi:hypothetical protein
MKLIRNLSWAVLLMCGFNACFSPPNYPIAPQINYNSLYYGKSTNPLKQDSIVLSINFKDGDGDLGLDDSYITDTTFALQFYYQFSNGSIVNYKAKRLNPNLNLPDFVTPYNCTNWEVRKDSKKLVTDTVYTKFNPNYYNIFVDFYSKNNDGSFTKFDPASYFIYPNCSVQGFNGRFPVLAKDPGKKSPLDGVINYSMLSFNFDDLFSIHTLKLQITIQDRALHKSNTIETPEFTLLSIRK